MNEQFSIIFYDDNSGYVEALRISFLAKGVEHCFITDQYEVALKQSERPNVRRVIADIVIDNRPKKDGVLLLSEIRAKRPELELIAITGREVQPEHRKLMQKNRIALIWKTYLSQSYLFGELLNLSQAITPESGLEVADRDLGEIMLTLSEKEEETRKLQKVHELLISDIIEELDTISDKNEYKLLTGDRKVDVSDLKHAVISLDDQIGLDVIRWHTSLFRRLKAASGIFEKTSRL